MAHRLHNGPRLDVAFSEVAAEGAAQAMERIAARNSRLPRLVLHHAGQALFRE